MSGPYDRDDREEIDEAGPADREISLGTGAMLGIFFALVLVCGAFFGFGYSMGHKAAPVSAARMAAGDTDVPVGTVTQSSGGVEQAGAGAPAVVVAPSAPAVKASAGRLAAAAPTPAAKSAAPALESEDETSGNPPGVKAPTLTRVPAKPVLPAPNPAPDADAQVAPAAPVRVPAAVLGGTTYVQVSAVSHAEDAQAMVSALRRRGYDATVRHESADQLLHIQLGPFATKKDADVMRQRLSADGYNAILKQ